MLGFLDYFGTPWVLQPHGFKAKQRSVVWLLGLRLFEVDSKHKVV